MSAWRSAWIASLPLRQAARAVDERIDSFLWRMNLEQCSHTRRPIATLVLAQLSQQRLPLLRRKK